MNNLEENSDEFDKSNLKIDGETVKGNAVATRVTRLSQKKDNEGLSDEEEIILSNLEDVKNSKQKVIHSRKKTQMDAGKNNSFLKPHNKDGFDSIHNTGTEIEPNKSKTTNLNKKNKRIGIQVFESIDAEIDSMRYLIEYMNNNNKIIK